MAGAVVANVTRRRISKEGIPHFVADDAYINSDVAVGVEKSLVAPFERIDVELAVAVIDRLRGELTVVRR